MSTRVEALERPAFLSRFDKPKIPQLAGQEEVVIVHKAQQQDQEAISTLYSSYFPKIYLYCLKRIQDSVEAEDLTSQVMIKVFANLASWQPRGKAAFKDWVYTIAKNTIISSYRKKRPQVELVADNIPAVSQFSNPEELVENQLLATQVLEAAKKLSESQRQVFHLRFVEGLSPGEIAKTTSRNINSVKVLQHKAVLKLRRILSSDGFGDILNTSQPLMNDPTTRCGRLRSPETIALEAEIIRLRQEGQNRVEISQKLVLPYWKVCYLTSRLIKEDKIAPVRIKS